MIKLMEDLTMVRYFEELFRSDRYRLKISEIGTAFPDEKSVDVDFGDVEDIHRDLGSQVLYHPVAALKSAPGNGPFFSCRA